MFGSPAFTARERMRHLALIQKLARGKPGPGSFGGTGSEPARQWQGPPATGRLSGVANRRRMSGCLLLHVVVIPLVAAVVLLLRFFDDPRPRKEPYAQVPIPLTDVDDGIRAVSADGFDVQGGFSSSTTLGRETRAEIVCIIASRDPGHRMMLELYRRVGEKWELVTATKEVGDVPGFGIRHDVRGEDPETEFKVVGHWIGSSRSEVTKSRLIQIRRTR